jgi:hypothetical protein
MHGDGRREAAMHTLERLPLPLPRERRTTYRKGSRREDDALFFVGLRLAVPLGVLLWLLILTAGVTLLGA